MSNICSVGGRIIFAGKRNEADTPKRREKNPVPVVSFFTFHFAFYTKKTGGFFSVPYLLQHAFNPVHWLPWGEEAFARAAKENKPVFLSMADHLATLSSGSKGVVGPDVLDKAFDLQVGLYDRDFTCSLPTTDVGELVAALQD